MGFSKLACKAISTVGTAKNFGKIHIPILPQDACKSIMFSSEPVARRILRQADKLLKDTGLRLQGELPVDQFMANVPKAKRKAVASLLGNPETVQFAAKHNPNGRFSIFSFLAKRGDKTVGKGALSVTDFGTPNAVAKWRASTGVKGKNLQVNGYADCAGSATPQNVSVRPTIGRMLGVETQIGTIGKSEVKVDAAKLARVLPERRLGNVLNTTPNMTVNQTQIDKILNDIRGLIG